MDSIGGTVYQFLRTSCVLLLLEGTIGEELVDEISGKPFHEMLSGITEMYGHDTSMLLRVLDDENSILMKNVGGKNQLLQDALTDTTITLFRNLVTTPISGSGV